MREVCTADLLANPVVTGGPNTTVKVDESLLTQRKNQQGHFTATVGLWLDLLGNVSRFRQRRRNAVADNTGIYSDLWWFSVDVYGRAIFVSSVRIFKKKLNLMFINRKIYSCIAGLLLNTVVYVSCWKSSWNLRLLSILVNTFIKF